MKEKNNEEELIQNYLGQYNFLNEAEDEVFSKYSRSIPETASNKIFNSIVRIELDNCIGTGFLIKIKTKSKTTRFLLTCNHVIEQKNVDYKTVIKIFYGDKSFESYKEIVLDKNQRFIKCFEKPEDITIIQILNSDHIIDDKFLIPDYNYKKGYSIYLQGNFYLAGYPIFKSNYTGERHICSGKILSINNYEFMHTLDTYVGSSGAPLCLIDDQTVIGIHKKGNKLTGYNYGTFIGFIVDYCSKQQIEEEDELYERLTLPKMLDSIYEFGKCQINAGKEKINEKLMEIAPIPFKFYTLEEYNKSLISFHNNISKHYKNQNGEKFDINLEKLINFLNKEKIVIYCLNSKSKDFDKNLFLCQLIDLKINEKNIDDELLENINNLLYTEIKYVLENISYFIAKVMMELNSYPFLDEQNCLLEFEKYMEINYLKKLKNSINNIVFINNFIKLKKNDNFLSNVSNAIFKINSYYRYLYPFEMNFNIKILINYNYKENNVPTCFKSLKDNKYIIPPFSFFKVMNVEINSLNRTGIITLKSVGRKEILENNDNLKNGLIYNEDKNIMEIKNNLKNK